MIGASRITGNRDLMHAGQKAIERGENVRFVVIPLFENPESTFSPSASLNGGFT
ncbi:MAG: hypothetical protein WCC86_02410 [Methanoregula sp.]|uniref:hypothetical protein n=1 Tax=Methanoregula sp. TaxID=2052170 RepID=UPI003BB13124